MNNILPTTTVYHSISWRVDIVYHPVPCSVYQYHTVHWYTYVSPNVGLIDIITHHVYAQKYLLRLSDVGILISQWLKHCAAKLEVVIWIWLISVFGGFVSLMGCPSAVWPAPRLKKFNCNPTTPTTHLSDVVISTNETVIPKKRLSLRNGYPSRISNILKR